MRGETGGSRSVATAGWGEASRRAAQQPHFSIYPLASAGGCDVVFSFHMHATLTPRRGCQRANNGAGGEIEWLKRKS